MCGSILGEMAKLAAQQLAPDVQLGRAALVQAPGHAAMDARGSCDMARADMGNQGRRASLLYDVMPGTCRQDMRLPSRSR